MTVKELRRILADLHEDAQVLVWDAERSAWARPTHDTSAVNPWSRPSSLFLGTSAHFADANECALAPLTELLGES